MRRMQRFYGAEGRAVHVTIGVDNENDWDFPDLSGNEIHDVESVPGTIAVAAHRKLRWLSPYTRPVYSRRDAGIAEKSMRYFG